MPDTPHTAPLAYLVIPLAGLRAAIAGLPPHTLGILLQLLVKCATEPSGGRIENAAVTTQAPVTDLPGLWHWEGETLVVDAYNASYEKKALSRRQRTTTTETEKPCTAESTNATTETEKPCAITSTGAPARAVPAVNKFMVGGKYIEYNSSIENKAPSHTPLHLTPPPTNNESFNSWKRLVLDTHPTGKAVRSVPYDVLCSAWQAFQVLPDIAAHAALLSAYMADKLQVNKYGKRFYRATGLARYFDTLADHLSHATIWARETGYKRPAAAGRASPPETTQTPPLHPPQATDADISAFIRELKQS